MENIQININDIDMQNLSHNVICYISKSDKLR